MLHTRTHTLVFNKTRTHTTHCLVKTKELADFLAVYKYIVYRACCSFSECLNRDHQLMQLSTDMI